MAASKILLGCIDAMMFAAQNNPEYIMDEYAIQTAIVLVKIDPAEELEFLQSWLDMDLPVTSLPRRINLKKRLAKAKQAKARRQGQNPKPYSQEVKKLDLEEKQCKEDLKSGKLQRFPSATGRSLVYGQGGRSFYQGTAASEKRSNTDSNQDTNSAGLTPSAKILTKCTSFVTVDFETANNSRLSACQIALAKFVDGKLADTFTTYLQPPPDCNNFTYRNIRLHGITPDKVSDAPSWSQIAEKVTKFVGSLPAFAHNASFDQSVWKHLDQHYQTSTLPGAFYCTLQLSRKYLSELSSHTLPEVFKILPG